MSKKKALREELRDELRDFVREEVEAAFSRFKTELLQELKAQASPPQVEQPPPAPEPSRAEEIHRTNNELNPPTGDTHPQVKEGNNRISTRGGMHVYGPVIPPQHANFAPPPQPERMSMPHIQPGEHANFAPEHSLEGPLAPAEVEVLADGGCRSIVDGHSDFSPPPQRWVGLDQSALPPIVRLRLPDQTRVTMPRGTRTTFEVGAYLLKADEEGS